MIRLAFTRLKKLNQCMTTIRRSTAFRTFQFLHIDHHYIIIFPKNLNRFKRRVISYVRLDFPFDSVDHKLTSFNNINSIQNFLVLKTVYMIILVSTSTIHPQLCTYVCRQITSDSILINSVDEYNLFEQALQKIRQEEQCERSLSSNPLIQTLKRQHRELMNIYHKQFRKNKIDQEQQKNSIK